ncbi:retrovirus-related pol polyprotein from transposon TNT 1-94 [Tanacetum coccineum]
MRVASINEKRYILVIIDDYSRFTLVRFLKTKDEASAAIIKCIKNIQVPLKATVRNVRTDNGTEFVNQTPCEFYENFGISHQTSVAYTPQQNGLSKYSLFTSDLSFLHVFGSLCYPTKDYDDLSKFNAKADIRIFVGYAPAKKAFRIYNRRTWIISETIHVTFDELTAMASEQFSLGPRLHYMTPGTSSTGLAAALRDEVLVDSPVSTSIDHDAPSTSKSISQGSSLINLKLIPCGVITMLPNFCRHNQKLSNKFLTEPSWIDAMQEKIHEFERLKVWELVPCPDKVFLIKLKWIYKVKTDEFGGVLKNKARLVAQGFRQEEGIDFDDTFGTVARIEDYKYPKIPRGIFINQSKYASEIVKKYGLHSSNSVDTPMIENKKLDEDLQGKQVDATLYRGMIGSLMYLIAVDGTVTYDVAYVPGLWYFKDTDMSLTAYVDADHAGCQDTRRSTSGGAQFLVDGPFTDLRLNRRNIQLTLEVFSDIFQIFPRVPGRDFDPLPSQEDTVSFLRELGHTGEINSLNDVVVDQMHQPWRTFATLINRGLSGKTSGLDNLRLSIAQIL